MKKFNEEFKVFDSIVLGSGIGGLTAASILAQLGDEQVLVLEQHSEFGGATHSFSRHGFAWDVGLHYVGEMQKGSPLRNVMDFITGGDVDWQRMPDEFEFFSYPGWTFKVPSNEESYVQELLRCFPDEQEFIRKYFKDIKAIRKTGVRILLPHFIKPLFDLVFHSSTRMAGLSVKEYFNRSAVSQKLATVLSSQWGDYGLPPSLASMFIHSQIVSHYLQGGYYPQGGSKTIAESVKRIVEKKQGQLVSSMRVIEIIDDGKRAKGVRAINSNEQSRVFFGRKIWSGMGLENTYRLIPEKFIDSRTRRSLDDVHKGSSVVSVYLGLKESPEILGLRGENYWIFQDWNHDELWRRSSLYENGVAEYCYLSFPSLKDRMALQHTAEILCIVPASQTAAWEKLSTIKQNYDQRKSEIKDSLLDLVESRIPGFRDLIKYVEVSSPLAVSKFLSQPSGQIYGVPADPSRLSRKIHPFRTPLKNLFLVGSDVFGHGIAGAMMGSVFSVALGANRKAFRILRTS